MAVINMINNKSETFPEGSVCWFSWNSKESRDRGSVIVTYESNKGMCVREREKNSYDDSDFYMTVWSEETQSAYSFQFATTRFWTYPCMGSSVDASPEIMEKFQKWEAYQSRKARVLKIRRFRQEQFQIARECNVTFKQLTELRVACVYEQVVPLLKTKKFRSEFRQSMANQVREWLNSTERKFKTPLSFKQLAYL
jgi:hypothetical protein